LIFNRKLSAGNLAVALVFSIIFFFLGIWQLGRAHDLQSLRNIQRDSKPIAIEKIAQPNSNLSSSAINKLVVLRGKYLKTYLAPNQIVKQDGKTGAASLEVRLLKLDSGAGILVVRGLANISEQSINYEVKVIGRLYPRQSSDLAKSDNGQLSRIDPSLITSDTQLALLDGYVVAISEQTKFGEAIATDRIPADSQLPKVAGYYWQHITYVVIWWLFALIVLLAPFYERIRDRKMRVG
jgi:cytochrome oxidase assembly protein ShyY1